MDIAKLCSLLRARHGVLESSIFVLFRDLAIVLLSAEVSAVQCL